jgi:hypothetical protein
LRYALQGPPVVQSQCQCRDCQRRSGSGHSSWLVFAENAAEVVSGPATHWSALAETGVEKQHGFCPVCGTPVFLTLPASPGIIAVHAASLDDPAAFAPVLVTWADTAQSWDRLDPSLTVFARMPPG